MALQIKTKGSTLQNCCSTKEPRSTADSLSLIDQLLPSDILRSIFRKLDYMDVVQCGAVSSHWKSLLVEHLRPSPCLLLPSKQRGDVNNNGYNCFYKLGDRQVSNLKRIPREFTESCCVGSSNGWLVFLEDDAVPSLFHPFKQVKIQLPSLLGELGLKLLKRNSESDYHVEYLDFKLRRIITKQQLRKYFIRKVVLTKEPDGNNEDFDVIMLCKYSFHQHSKIAYYKSGDGSWKGSNSLYEDMCDITWQENNLYVLKDGGTKVEVWDLEGNFMSTKTDFVIQLPSSFPKLNLYWNSIRPNFYLIESCGDILLAVRSIRTIIRDPRYLYFFPEVIEPNIYPYKTYLFQLYKLDADNNQWTEMKSLDNRVLFLGGNQSISVSIQSSFPNYEGNSIYYIDDYWNQTIAIGNDSMYGAQDSGIYNLKDGTIKAICEFSTEFVPPPFWIIP